MDSVAGGDARTPRLAELLRLHSIPGLGRARAARWIQTEGGVGRALARAIREVGVPELDGASAAVEAERVLADCSRCATRLLLRGSPAYPKRLQALADPPDPLYLRGRGLDQDEVAVAIVGSRRATAYGRRIAREMGRALGAAGVTVVSGLALGIDGEAHGGALEGGGRTVAVLANGLDRAYPRSHARLYRDLLVQGGAYAEHPPGVTPRPYHFPERNRLIATLVRGVVVVEAAERSGALVTARMGLEAGVDVWGVPGRIDVPSAAGVHALLRDGARPVCSIGEVVAAYAPSAEASTGSDPINLSPLAARAWTALEPGEADVDALLARWSGPAPSTGALLAALAELELGGWVVRGAGACWVRRAA